MKVVHFSETFKINNPAAWHNDLNAECQYCGKLNLTTVMVFKNNYFVLWFHPIITG